MTANRVYTDRSRYLEYQQCPRKRYLAYHWGGRGLEPKRRSWHLALGSAVHAGLESLLRDSIHHFHHGKWSAVGRNHDLRNCRVVAKDDPLYHLPLPKPIKVVRDEDVERLVEGKAVMLALETYDRETAHGLVVDREESALAESAVVVDPRGESLTQLLKESLDVHDLGTDFVRSGSSSIGSSSRPDDSLQQQESQPDYTRRELRALTEAMIRAYARRRLPALLAEFDVLEVEREGEWKLSELQPAGNPGYWHKDANDRFAIVGEEPAVELWFASRPDALLLHRATQTLHIMSFKTTGVWDQRKLRDAERDVQGLSEGVEVERRLEGWWKTVFDGQGLGSQMGVMTRFLQSCPAPPRIHAIRYEYLLKGTRKQEDRGPLEGMWTQRSPLIRGYYAEKTGEWAHSWTWQEEDELGTGTRRTLSWQKFKGRPAWDRETFETVDGMSDVHVWINSLDRMSIQPSAGDVLADQFPAPITVYRSDDDLRDWLEQVEAQETEVARAVADVNNAPRGVGWAAYGIEDERSKLNRLFPQHRRSCSYPSDCQFVPVCFGPGDVKADPLGTGLFQVRVPNHKQEFQEKA